MSLLTNIIKTKTKSSKRPGRGYGSGKGGHTSGRGMKGQNSREGNGAPLWFEGGQLPMSKRYPMIRGKGRFKVLNQSAEITLTELEKLSVKEVTLETLKLHKVIERGFRRAKIINTGELTKKVNVKGISATASARKAIEKLGGSVA